MVPHVGPIAASTSSFSGQPSSSTAFPGRPGSPSSRRWGSAGTCARASAAPPSSMPTASSPTTCATAPMSGARNRAIPFLKRFTVFNAEQCEGLPDSIGALPTPVDTSLILPQAEQLIRATGADIRIGGDKAYYDVVGDFIRVPPPQAFFEPINFSRTVTHELGHWSGAGPRLNRDLSGSFGSKTYLQEELCAEICSAYVCAALGIVPTVRHADYLGAWLDHLRED